MATYELVTWDGDGRYVSRHNAVTFTFAFLSAVLDYEINEPRNWSIVRNGVKIANAYEWNSRRLAGETEEQLLAFFQGKFLAWVK